MKGRFFQSNLFFFILYLVLSTIVHALGVNIFTTTLAMGDGYLVGLPMQIFSKDLSLWNPYLQNGTFTVKNTYTQALYLPGLIIVGLFPNPFGYNLLLILHYCLAGFFTFLFLKRLNLSRTAAFIGGLSFMFCGFLSAHKTHHPMVMAAAYLPMVLYFFETYVDSKHISYQFITAAVFALSIFADYPAVSMYIGMVVFPYLVFRILNSPYRVGQPLHKKAIAIFANSAIIFVGGLFVAAAQILPLLEALKYISRENISYEFFSAYSFPFSMLPALIFPSLYGAYGHLHAYTKVFYFGPWNLVEMSGYMGLLPIIFAFLCVIFFRKKNWQIYFWVSVAMIAFLLVLGNSTPMYQAMYYVPLYNKFRAPARNWLEVNFAVAILGSFFIQNLISNERLSRRAYYKVVLPTLVAFSGLMIVALGFARSSFPYADRMAAIIKNTQITSPAVYSAFITFFWAAVLLVLAYRHRRRKIFWAAVGVFIFLDLFSFSYLAISPNTYKEYRFFQNQPHEVADFLLSKDHDRSQYRIISLNSVVNDDKLVPATNILYGFSTPGYFGPIWLKDFRDLTRLATNGEPSSKSGLLQNRNLLAVLSTKYVITSNEGDKNLLQNFSIYTKVFEASDGTAVYENLNFLPRARFVKNIVQVNDAAEASSVLWESPTFNPATTALVVGLSDEKGLDGQIISVDYSRNDTVKLVVKIKKKGFLVLSDSFYLGWKAYDNGQETPIYKTNGALRGIRIEGSGKHQIVFKFAPTSFYIGMAITSSTLLLGGMWILWALYRKNSSKGIAV